MFKKRPGTKCPCVEIDDLVDLAPPIPQDDDVSGAKSYGCSILAHAGRLLATCNLRPTLRSSWNTARCALLDEIFRAGRTLWAQLLSSSPLSELGHSALVLELTDCTDLHSDMWSLIGVQMAFNLFQQYVNIIIDLCTYPKKVNGRHAVLSVGSLQRSFTDVFEHSAQHIAAASRFGIFYDMLIYDDICCIVFLLLSSPRSHADKVLFWGIAWNLGTHQWQVTSLGHHLNDLIQLSP